MNAEGRTERSFERRMPARIGAPFGSAGREPAFRQHDVPGAQARDEAAGEPPGNERIYARGDGNAGRRLRAHGAGPALVHVYSHIAARRRVEPDALGGQRCDHGDALGAWQLVTSGARELARHHETSVAAP